MINHKAFCGFRSNEESQNLVIIPDLTHNLVLAVCPHPDITENPQEQKNSFIWRNTAGCPHMWSCSAVKPTCTWASCHMLATINMRLGSERLHICHWADSEHVKYLAGRHVSFTSLPGFDINPRWLVFHGHGAGTLALDAACLLIDPEWDHLSNISPESHLDADWKCDSNYGT